MEQKREKRDLDGLPELQQRIDVWRRTREKPGRMPEGLWREAAKLARKHGVNPVKEALGLDYYSLRGRVDGAKRRGKTRSAGRSPTFVEVRPVRETLSGNVLEIEKPGGTKVTVRLCSAADVAAVLESFWRCQG
jgi:hypothetical protein